MKLNRKFLLFLLILLIGFFMRFYQFPAVPPGLNRDEASIGYNAYSLLKTGKDEYGRLFPIAFQSFGDWKLPLYIYETAISVKLFGLNEFAVRLPSALAGAGLVAITYFLVEELFSVEIISFLSMILIAISPWSVHFSRVGYEANMAVFFTALALLLFLKSIKNKPQLQVYSAILLSLCLLTYAGNYVSTSLLVIGVIIFYKKEVFSNKYFLISGVAFGVISLLAISSNLSANHTKISGIGIFGDPAVVYAKIDLKRLEYKNPNSLQAKFFNNKIIYAAETIFQNYLKSYSPQFLFITGGTNSAHNIQNFGNMYISEAPFLLLGLIYLVGIKTGKEKKLIVWWFSISAIASSITKDAPHSARMETVLPALQIITAFGLWWAYKILRGSVKRYLYIGAVIVLFFINVGIYLDRYYVHFPYIEAQNWGIGYKKISYILEDTKYQNKGIIMSRPQESPYIFLAFYQKWDPADYQKNAIRYPMTSDGFLHVKAFNKFEFRSIDWNKDLGGSNKIIIEHSEDVPSIVRSQFKTIDILLPSGKPMFTIISL